MEFKSSLNPVLEERDPLLIIAPPFNDLILASLYIVNERARRGRISHAKWLTMTYSQDLKEVVERYPAILFVDPPTKINIEGFSEVLSNKKVYLMRTSEIDWLKADVELEFSNSIPRSIWQSMGDEEVNEQSLKFIITAMAHEASVSQYVNKILDKTPMEGIEVLEYPAIPGLLLMPIYKALSHSISPIIPSVTGNEDNAKNIIKGIIKNDTARFGELSSHDMLEIIRAMADSLLEYDIRSAYLDKLMIGFIKWRDTNVDVLEILLSIESQLSFWNHVMGILNPIIDPDMIIRNVAMPNLISNYLSILGHVITDLLMDKSPKPLNIEQPLPIMDRVCSITTFTSKRFTLELQSPHWIIKCPRLDGDEDAVFNRYGYSIAIKVVGAGEGEG